MQKRNFQAPLKLLPGPQELRVMANLSPLLLDILGIVKREVSRLEIEICNKDELEILIQKACTQLGLTISNNERDIILKEIDKEGKAFGALQALVDDEEVSDIICCGYNDIQVQKGRYAIPTDIKFSSQDAYEAFIEKILLRAGATYSNKKPISDGMIGAFARIHVVHKCIAEGGPYLTVRLNRFSKVTLRDTLKAEVAPLPILEYLRKLVVEGHSLLIVGEVGTGKTTLARALASCIPPHESILVCEDTPEIRLEHRSVRYVTTRAENADGEGRVSPAEVIRGGMRMAMNRIIFGEIRDAEAAESFIDVCASGHPGLSTIHAKSPSEAIVRLQLFLGRAQRGVTKEILLEQISSAVSAIVFVQACKVTGKRRIFEVREIGSVADGTLRQTKLFSYTFNGEPTWTVHNKLSSHKEMLESGNDKLILSKLPDVLKLMTDATAKEIQEQVYQ